MRRFLEISVLSVSEALREAAVGSFTVVRGTPLLQRLKGSRPHGTLCILYRPARVHLDSGHNPHSDSLFSETRDSPYANVLAVNADAQSDPRIHALASALTSSQARSFIAAHYAGAIYPAD